MKSNTILNSLKLLNLSLAFINKCGDIILFLMQVYFHSY